MVRTRSPVFPWTVSGHESTAEKLQVVAGSAAATRAAGAAGAAMAAPAVIEAAEAAVRAAATPKTAFREKLTMCLPLIEYCACCTRCLPLMRAIHHRPWLFFKSRRASH